MQITLEALDASSPQKASLDHFIAVMKMIAKEVKDGRGEKLHAYPVSTPRQRPRTRPARKRRNGGSRGHRLLDDAEAGAIGQHDLAVIVLQALERIARDQKRSVEIGPVDER